MFRNIFVCWLLLLISLPANSALIDLGPVTRDTSTNLDWLDLTETNGRSYNDVSSELRVGGEFEGWRHATSEEALTLWANFGLPVPSQASTVFTPQEYAAFVNAVSMLGNTYLESDPARFDLGAVGMTSTTKDPGSDAYHERIGAYHHIQNFYSVASYLSRDNAYFISARPILSAGTYLVSPVAMPSPPTIFLLSFALFGIFCLMRRTAEP